MGSFKNIKMSDRSENSIGQQNKLDDELSNFTDSTHESILDTDIMHRIAELSSDDDSDEEKITMNNIAKEILLPKSDAYLLPNLTKSHFELELNGKKWYQRSKSYVPEQVVPYYTIMFSILDSIKIWYWIDLFCIQILYLFLSTGNTLRRAHFTQLVTLHMLPSSIYYHIGRLGHVGIF